MTRQQAIHAFCKMCIYDEGSLGAGTWRKQTTDCTSHDCPLYDYRPLDITAKNERTAERVANMTPEQLAKREAKAQAFKERIK